MFIVDMEQGRIIPDDELKEKICKQQPYGEWLKANKIKVEDLPAAGAEYRSIRKRIVVASTSIWLHY
jgi:glutamate synthase (NADPH/NADH) large chain